MVSTATASGVGRATSTPTQIAPSATPIVSETAERVAKYLQKVDEAWGQDWGTVVYYLNQARMLSGADATLTDKLYAAYYNYGRALLAKGNRFDAAIQFRNALGVKADGAEAQHALLELTPTATPPPATATVARSFATATPAAPPATPTPTTLVIFVTVNGASPGSEASVTVKTAPYAKCEIYYSTARGNPGQTKGREPKQADQNGEVSWQWTIGPGTKRGDGSVTVTCNGTTRTTAIRIG